MKVIICPYEKNFQRKKWCEKMTAYHSLENLRDIIPRATANLI